MKKALFLCLISVLYAFELINAQTAKPKHWVDKKDGRLYWNKKLPVYVWVSSTPDSAELLLQNAVDKKLANPMFLDNEGINYIRHRYAANANGAMVSPKKESLLEIYGDGIAPNLNGGIGNAKKYIYKNVSYFAENATITLAAKDATSGVEKIFIKINDGNFQPYSQPIPFTDNGNYELQYYAVDNVGNASKVQSQLFTVDNQAPISTINFIGKTTDDIIGLNSKIYLTKDDEGSGLASTYFKFNNNTYKDYSSGNINFFDLQEGPHAISFYSTDNVGNKEKENVYNFYLDRSAPLMAADILGDKFLANGKVYFSARTKLKITAIDNKVGVQEVKYNIDGAPFEVYNQPFYLPSVAGNHDIRFYAIDKLGNQTTSAKGSSYEEFTHDVSKVYVDIAGPVVDYKIVGDNLLRNDTLIIGPKTQLQINASDPESGLNKIAYSFDGVVEEIEYTKPVNKLENGYHTFEMFAYDNVNNRNVNKMAFFTDAEPPIIFTQFGSGKISTRSGLNVYNSKVKLFLSATDEIAGLRNITYSINGASPKIYNEPISNFLPKEKISILIVAEDAVGNKVNQTLNFYTSK